MSAIVEERLAVPGGEKLVSVDIAAAPAPSAWVRGPAWDSVWILNALWLGPHALWLAGGHADRVYRMRNPLVRSAARGLLRPPVPAKTHP